MNYIQLLEATDYFPHVGQLRFHESDARFKVLIAGARFGKSLAAGKEVLRELLTSTSHGWLIGPTRALTMPEFAHLAGSAEKLAVLAGTRAHAEYDSLLLSHGGRVDCLSARVPHSLLGKEVDWMILCEAARLDSETFWRVLRARLTTRQGRLIVPTTPWGHNWIEQLYQRGLGGVTDWESFRYATWDNPLIAPSEIEDARSQLPAEVFDEQYGGAFTARSGRVYAEFERAVHVRDALAAPQGAVFFRALDFGYVNPFVCLWGALDNDDRLLVFDEYVATCRTLDVHAAEIARRDETNIARGLVAGFCVADPAGRGEREELARMGLPNARAENALSAGIDAVRRRLGRRADGTRGLLIASHCHNLIREFESYCFADGAGAREALPLKGNDHCLDALRYLCMALSRRVGWREASEVC
jgi:hypothetical protein